MLIKFINFFLILEVVAFCRNIFLAFCQILWYNYRIGGDSIQKLISRTIFLFAVFVIFISVFFIPVLEGTTSHRVLENPEILDLNPNGFVWPIPGYTRLSSPFGKRTAPTGGASSFHYGTDIPAPEGTKLIAIADGQITFRSFLGAGGYTITLSFDNYKVSYCHVSPNFIVNVGDFVSQGQLIRLCWS